MIRYLFSYFHSSLQNGSKVTWISLRTCLFLFLSFSFFFDTTKKYNKRKKKNMNKIYYTLLPFLFLQRSSDNIDLKNWKHNFLLFSSSFVFENCGKSQNNTKAKTMKFNVKSTWLGFPFIYIYICDLFLGNYINEKERKK